jgi:hypothetical protein
MSATRKAELEELAETLDGIIENPPPQWRDPDGDGSAAPSRDKLSWSVWCRAGGAHAAQERLQSIENDLPVLRRRLEIHSARREDGAARDVGQTIPVLEAEAERLKRLIDAAGPWMQHDAAALKGAISTAEQTLGDATTWLQLFHSARNMIRPDLFADVLPKLQKEQAKAEAALRGAQAKLADLTISLDATRAELGRMRLRAAS